MNIKLSEHFTFKKLILFTFPTICMILFSSIYGVVDGFFVSNFVGSFGFAAVNIVWPFEIILGSIGMMMGTGGSALISKTLGEQKFDEANNQFSIILIFLTILGICFAILSIVFAKELILILPIDNDALTYSLTYARILFIFIPLFIFQNTFQSFLIVAERPDLGLYSMIASGVSNILLDYIFIVPLKLGILGAALATGISQAIGGLIPLFYFLLKKNHILKFIKPNFDFDILIKSASNGISELLSNISFSVVSLVYNFVLIRAYGISGVNAYGVILYIGYMFISIYFGFSLGVSPLIGYNFGAENKIELQNLFKKSVIFILTSSICLTFLSEVFAKSLATFFVGYDTETLSITLNGIHIYVISYLLSGFNIFSSSLFTALNDGMTSGIISFLRTLVFQILTVLIVPLVLGNVGIWSAVIFSELLSFIVSVSFILKNRYKYNYF